jgi:hypothetical protein
VIKEVEANEFGVIKGKVAFGCMVLFVAGAIISGCGAPTSGEILSRGGDSMSAVVESEARSTTNYERPILERVYKPDTKSEDPLRKFSAAVDHVILNPGDSVVFIGEQIPLEDESVTYRYYFLLKEIKVGWDSVAVVLHYSVVRVVSGQNVEQKITTLEDSDEEYELSFNKYPVIIKLSSDEGPEYHLVMWFDSYFNITMARDLSDEDPSERVDL